MQLKQTLKDLEDVRQECNRVELELQSEPHESLLLKEKLEEKVEEYRGAMCLLRDERGDRLRKEVREQRLRSEEQRHLEEVQSQLATATKAVEDSRHEIALLKEKLLQQEWERSRLQICLEVECKQRLGVEAALQDLRQELGSPLVIPAIMQAFSHIASLTSQSVNGTHEDSEKSVVTSLGL